MRINPPHPGSGLLQRLMSAFSTVPRSGSPRARLARGVRVADGCVLPVDAEPIHPFAAANGTDIDASSQHCPG